MNVYFMYRSKLSNQFMLTVHWIIKLWWSCSAWPIESLETSYGSLDLYMKYTFSWEAMFTLNLLVPDPEGRQEVVEVHNHVDKHVDCSAKQCVSSTSKLGIITDQKWQDQTFKTQFVILNTDLDWQTRFWILVKHEGVVSRGCLRLYQGGWRGLLDWTTLY